MSNFLQNRIIISWNEKATKWLRLEGTSVGHLIQPPQLKQGHLEPRTMSRWLLSISREGDATTSLGNHQCFLMFRQHLTCFSFCPLCLVLSLGIIEKSLAPSSLYLPFRYLYALMRTLLSLAFSRLNSLSSLSLSSHARCS